MSVIAKEFVPPDQKARETILNELELNILVEAGAGSGKTTSLIGRIQNLVDSGKPIDSIAAVTFTRKAANELRERLQVSLEQKIHDDSIEPERARRFDIALRDLDRAFIGTIHSFCGRLLREHPIELTLDPNFVEVTDVAWEELARSFWARWIERTKQHNDADWAELNELAIEPRSLFASFSKILEYIDVDFSAEPVAIPSVGEALRDLEHLLATADTIMPSIEPSGGWDGLMAIIRTLKFRRHLHDWTDIATFCSDIQSISRSQIEKKVVLQRWTKVRADQAAVKELRDGFLEWFDGSAAELLRVFNEYRYPTVLRFLQRAAVDFARERHATAQLGFTDLLLLSAQLLREHPHARRALGARYSHLLVDEFQDTDPIQAEVCFLLSSDPAQGNDWTKVSPRPGSLFFVGDPKQSIYRFRRADIQVYDFVKTRIEQCGVVVALTCNFRSTHSIADFVNEYFGIAFPAEADDVQAAFRPMSTVKEGATNTLIRHSFTLDHINKDLVWTTDAERLASWIAHRITVGDRSPEDFLILTPQTYDISAYARALSLRNIPVSTSGAQLVQEHELRELCIVLRAIADPENPVLVVAALEGLFFGCSPADLFDAHLEHVHFGITHRPSNEDGLVGVALTQLYEWWTLSQRSPSDVLLQRIINDTGLLSYAASQSLGSARAGVFLHLIEALRAESVLGVRGVSDAMNQIELMLADRDAADTPLRPGRSDAVRVMNLHKAKGLEAKVVILAAPLARTDHEPTLHIQRGSDGRPHGGIVFKSNNTIVAQPPGWSELAKREMRFANAEQERLLYVAATRPEEELVISRCFYQKSKETVILPSLWEKFDATLTEYVTEVQLPATPAEGRRTPDRTAPDIASLVTAVNARVAQASVSSLTMETVTESAKDVRHLAKMYDLKQNDGRGAAWGRAVHQCIEAMGRGRSGTSLQHFIDAVAASESLNAELVSTLHTVMAEIQSSDVWNSFTANNERLFECRVMQYSDRDTDTQVDGTSANTTNSIHTPTLREGVVDAAIKTDNGWHIIDWKTDLVQDDAWDLRKAKYDRQVAAYETIFKSVTGLPTTSEIERVATMDLP